MINQILDQGKPTTLQIGDSIYFDDFSMDCLVLVREGTNLTWADGSNKKPTGPLGNYTFLAIAEVMAEMHGFHLQRRKFPEGDGYTFIA
jgi:hypothetical protein